MKYSAGFLATVLVFMLSGLVSFATAAEDIPRSQFLKISQMMMIKPCTVPSYMACLGIEQSFCEKSVKASFGVCGKKVNIPKSISRSNVGKVMESYGGCMTGEITQRMKLSGEKLKKCESILKSSVQIPNQGK